jgi:thiamine biosynthesis lipoprotein
MLALENSAFTASGDYQRYIMVDGVRYHHIINPETGYPARKCRSVTIVAKRAEDADALSTAVFVLGPQRGLKLVQRLPGIEAIIVDAEGTVHISTGLEGKVRLMP